MVEIRVILGDITQSHADAIVNAANAELLPGGGVCGAIFKAAGPDLIKACQELRSCATGQAVLTPGFNLQAKFILHAVGPIWHGGHYQEDKLLRSCYLQCLKLADENSIFSVAFPAISTGIYAYPLIAATEIAVKTISTADTQVSLVEFVCFDQRTYDVYKSEVNKIGTTKSVR